MRTAADVMNIDLHETTLFTCERLPTAMGPTRTRTHMRTDRLIDRAHRSICRYNYQQKLKFDESVDFATSRADTNAVRSAKCVSSKRIS